MIEGTNWVTVDEYPHRFVVRLQNGTIRFFKTASAISAYLNLIDRTTLWFVGFESFSGMMGFYLNLQDQVQAHGQYLYWPRLRNGRITAYDVPLYGMYPLLLVKTEGGWTEQILTDQTLYVELDQNPQNTLEFYTGAGEYGVSFFLPEVRFQDSTWNVQHGFKYRLADQQFHMISNFECLDKDFDDLGLAYEITTAPQSEKIPYSPDKYIIQDEETVMIMSTQEVWQAYQYFEDFISQVTLIAENNEGFTFTFDDMACTGFTQKYLELHNQQLPDGIERKVLRAGMYGIGAYSAGTRIEIDPGTGTIPVTDDYDLFMWSSMWITSSSTFMIGDAPYQPQRYAFVAFDTGINSGVRSVSNISFQLWFTSSNMEGNDGIGVRIYYVGGSTDGDGSGQAREPSTSWTQGNSTAQNHVWTNPGVGQYSKGSTSKMDTLLEYWADFRGESENWVNFRLHGNYNGMGDSICGQDAQYGSSRAAKLAFNYNTTYILISGWVEDSTSHNPLPSVHIDLYQSTEKVNGSLTDSVGYYSFWVDNSSLQHTLWAWHEAYQSKNSTLTPTSNQEVNFSLSLETAPTPSPSSSCKSPSSYSDPYDGWGYEFEGYTKGGNYSVGNATGLGKTVSYTNFGWSIPSGVTIQGVKVYIHWKKIIDDALKVRLHWNESGGQSYWYTLENRSDWTLDMIDFTNETSWTAAKINANALFKVELERVIENTADLVLVDWVGTYIEYYDIRAEDIAFASGSYKGTNQSFGLKFKNYGTVTSPSSTIYAKVKIEALNYTNYHSWVSKEFSYSIGTLDPGETSSSPIYKQLPYVYQGYCDSKCETWNGTFAMNIGTYSITDVFVYTSTWNTSTSFSGEVYTVSYNGYSHKVFCVILEDSAFRSRYGTTQNWNGSDFSGGYGASDWEYHPWASCDWTYNEYFSIDLIPCIVYSYDFTANNTKIDPDIPGEVGEEAYNKTRVILGLENPWDEEWGTSGTSTDNHGFDLLWILMDFVDGNPHGGLNRIVIRCWDGPNNEEKDAMFHIMQHELGHCYSAVEVPDNGSLCVMGKGVFNNFDSHEFLTGNFNTVTGNVEYFDGPS